MKIKLLLLLCAWLTITLAKAQSVVINKIYNSGITSQAGTGDIIELLVLEDHLDMRNMVLKDFSGVSSAGSTSFTDAGGSFKFKNIAFWSSVRIGTLIVLERQMGGTAFTEDIDASDRVLSLRAGDTDYFDYGNAGSSFNVTNYDMVMIKSGTIAGVDNAIHTVAFGIGAENATFNGITGAKMRTTFISPTAGFLYPMNNTVSVADFNSVGELFSSGSTPTTLTWGTGTGANNIAFINIVRDIDYLYVKKSGNETVSGNKSFLGSVAIGTTDPKGYKLAVAGNIIAEEIKVKLQGNWPDFVFDKKYALLSLPELEKFIKENKHLPGVPSEEEVKSTGEIPLGEMNRILLKKIEELTLYIIEQDKLIKKVLEDRK